MIKIQNKSQTLQTFFRVLWALPTVNCFHWLKKAGNAHPTRILMALLIKDTLKLIFLLCTFVPAAELLRKRKSEAIPSFVIRQSSFVILLFSGRPGLYSIIRSQDCLQHGSADGPGFIRDREAIASLTPWIDVTDFQPFRNLTVRTDKSTQDALYT